MFQLIHRVVRHAPLYWVQRIPQELASFQWVIDAKHAAEPLTPWEQWWSHCILSALQSLSAQEPMDMVVGFDYSHFQRFMTDWEPWAFPGRNPPADGKAVNIKLLMTEHFRFSAAPEPGLELVDILTSAVRRALRGSLGPLGWSGLPRLMLHQKQHYLQLVALGDAVDDAKSELKYTAVIKAFARYGRDMVAEREGQAA